MASVVHTGTVSLHNGSVAIYVNDETGQVIALAMYEAIGVVIVAILKTNASTHIVGHTQTLYIERFVDLDRRKRQDAHCYATNLVVSHTHKVALPIFYGNDITLYRLTVNTLYGTRKHPWVKTTERVFLSGLEYKSACYHCSTLLLKEKFHNIIAIGIYEQTKEQEQAYGLSYLHKFVAGLATGHYLI